MDAPTTASLRSGIRKQFLRRLLELDKPKQVNLNSMAFAFGCHPSLLTRYLKEATTAGVVKATPLFRGGPLEITVLDRVALAEAAGERGRDGQVAVRESDSQN